jgi:hypothetical protein
MYIPDGKNMDYPGVVAKNVDFYAWGWLDSEYEYSWAWPSKEDKQIFLDLVKQVPVTDLYRGSHTDLGFGLTHEHGSNGSRKFEHDGIIYVAPAAVIFYIETLNYYPPKQVRDALAEHIKKIIIKGSIR